MSSTGLRANKEQGERDNRVFQIAKIVPVRTLMVRGGVAYHDGGVNLQNPRIDLPGYKVFSAGRRTPLVLGPWTNTADAARAASKPGDW